ncbi:MAG: hypothetical protein AB7R55_09665, partial [Gemmatimonadales bacterium]
NIEGGEMAATAKRRSGHPYRLLWLAMVSAGLSLVVGLLRREHLLPAGVETVAVLVPVIPLVAFFLGFAGWIRGLDELERLIHLEALVVQFGGTGILAMAYGALARAGAVPDVPASHAYPFLWVAIFVFWAIGLAVVRRKYR